MKRLGKEYYMNKSYKTNEGHYVKIINWVTSKNISIQYDDGTIADNIMLGNLKRGTVKKFISLVGNVYTTVEGYGIKVIEHTSFHYIIIEFPDGMRRRVSKSSLYPAQIRNFNHPSVYGVGYLGYGKYRCSVNKKLTVEYTYWSSMIERGYCPKYKIAHPSYKDTTVRKEWHNFQNFAKWYEENWKPHMENWNLDKDILIKGNKIYSPETCCFVPQELNKLFTLRQNHRGKYPIGVTKTGNKFTAQINKQGVRIILGIFNTPEEAFYEYKVAKEQYIKESADEWKPLTSEECYQAMYRWEIEITD